MGPTHFHFAVVFLSSCVLCVLGNHKRDCPSDICQLPACHCASKDPPRNLSRKQTPQFVIASFDDGLTRELYNYYTNIFNEKLLNPDMTNLRATFFVSGDWRETDYELIRRLYDYGHEMGSHSVTHRAPQDWWKKAINEDLKDEFVGMREKLAFELGIDEKAIRGARAPFLNANGDEYFTMMKENNFKYDATLLTNVDEIIWPYTLDYGYAHEGCIIDEGCIQKDYEGLWEMPVVQLESLQGNTCSMMDDCRNDPFIFDSKAKIERYLFHNFNKRYDGLRAPLGLHLHGRWLKTRHQWEAFEYFIKTVNRLPDVWVVTINDLLEWMKEPKSVRELKTKVPAYWNYTLAHDTMYARDAVNAFGILKPTLPVILLTVILCLLY